MHPTARPPTSLRLLVRGPLRRAAIGLVLGLALVGAALSGSCGPVPRARVLDHLAGPRPGRAQVSPGGVRPSASSVSGRPQR